MNRLTCEQQPVAATSRFHFIALPAGPIQATAMPPDGGWVHAQPIEPVLGLPEDQIGCRRGSTAAAVRDSKPNWAPIPD